MKIIECSAQEEFNQIVDRAGEPQPVKQRFDANGFNSICLQEDGEWDGYSSISHFRDHSRYSNATFLTAREYLSGKTGKRGRPRTKPPK